jgi:hypothetical protein
MLRLRPSRILFLVLVLAALAAAAAEPSEDHRAWQHGVDVLRVGDRLLVVWASPGNPPRANPGGDWQHDVYYAWLNSSAAGDALPLQPRVLVARREAQEPSSTAINSRGTILMTAEDGNGGINQLAGLWDSSLRVLRKYPFTIRRGGHSGHVASMQDRFLVVYGEGWVAGGGWLDLGTGENVHARIVENDGTPGRELKLSANRDSGPRDSWPLVAGSDRNWLVVWQRYPELTLQSALVDASGKIVRQGQIIGDLPLRYSYDVGYAPQIASYVVAGTSAGKGFVSLVSLAGDTTRTLQGLPPMAAESRLILGWDGENLLGVYPVRPRGVAVVRLRSGEIEMVEFIDHDYAWDHAGTTGAFVGKDRVLLVTLAKTGLRLVPINLRNR